MARKKKKTEDAALKLKASIIGDLIDATGSNKDSWNPAVISDDLKAINYIRRLADTWNPAQLNEALKYLGFKTVDTWNPAELEETKNKIVKYFIPTNASGNPIELDLKGALPYEVSKLSIDLLPIQDLHGYNSPWVGGAGKNKCPLEYYGDNTDQTLFPLKAGTYTFSFRLLGTARYSTSNISIRDNDNNIVASINVSGHSVGETLSVTFTTTEDYSIRLFNSNVILDSNNKACDKIQIESGSSVTAWTPYENICPISGRNSVTLTINTEDTTITLPQTVYGGNVNVLEGGTSSTYGYIASYDGEEIPGEWLSDRDAYAAGTDPTTGAEVAYVLTTPTELTTPANEIDLVNGVNTLSTDGDNINITYKAILNS